MEIFVLSSDANNYANLVFADENQWELIYRFDGSPLQTSWRPLEVKFLNRFGGRELPLGDFPSFHSHMPVFSKRATEVLKDVLENSGEMLPLICLEGDFYLLNVTNVIDALDEARSEIVFLADGKVLTVKKASFDYHRLNGIDIFKLPQLPFGSIYVSQKVVERIEMSALTGFLLERA